MECDEQLYKKFLCVLIIITVLIVVLPTVNNHGQLNPAGK
jgi:hypothetical protein